MEMCIRTEHPLLLFPFFDAGCCEIALMPSFRPELRGEIFCSQKFYRLPCNDFTRIPINASTMPMGRNKAEITLATSAATRSRARTIYIIISSSNAASCQDSTVRIVRTARNIRRT